MRNTYDRVKIVIGMNTTGKKSNSTVKSLRVEANNQPETSTVIVQFLLQMYNKDMFDPESEDQSDRTQNP